MGNFEEQLGEGLATQLPRLGESQIAAALEEVNLHTAKFSPSGIQKIKKMFALALAAHLAKTNAPTNACSTTCTPTCASEHAKPKGKKYPICDLPYSATSYDESPTKSSAVPVQKWLRQHKKKAGWPDCSRYRVAQYGRHPFENLRQQGLICASCPKDKVLTVRFAEAKAGRCGVYNSDPQVFCTTLDKNTWNASPDDKNKICTK